jgi:acyl carrier protein
MDTTTSTLDDVRLLVAETLGISDRLDSLTASTRLLGELPELDSMAVAELIAAISDRFGIDIDIAGLSADAFETVGSLTDFIAAHQG